MNNYQNFMGQRYPMMQPMQNYNFQPMAQMQNVPPTVQPVGEPLINYDFYGVQVRSFEEAKNYPYCCEKPLFLLDAQNEKVYIKKLENGIPSVVSYDLKEIKENSTPNIQENIKSEEKNVPQVDFSAELQKMKQELQESFQKQINELKTTNENENKGNKKW